MVLVLSHLSGAGFDLVVFLSGGEFLGCSMGLSGVLRVVLSWWCLEGLDFLACEKNRAQKLVVLS